MNAYVPSKTPRGHFWNAGSPIFPTTPLLPLWSSLVVPFRYISPCRLPGHSSVLQGSPTQPSRQRLTVGSLALSLLAPISGKEPRPAPPTPPGTKTLDPNPGGGAPTEVEAFVLVLGVEEDPLGVGIDVRPSRDEHRGDISLPPLDGDVERRLPCGPVGVGEGRSAAGTRGTTRSLAVPFSSLCTLHGSWRNTSCLSGRRRPATKSPNFILCFIHSCLEARIILGASVLCSNGNTTGQGCGFNSGPLKAHSLPENLVLRWGKYRGCGT